MVSGSAMRDRLAASLEAMLNRLPREDQVYEMKECERLLEEAGYLIGSPRRESAAKFAQDLFHNNPGTHDLVANALKQGKDWDPAGGERSPAGLVAMLIPGDGHLD